ncbi:hypothetical protein D7X94_08625 [Acutalibacter sp. 1XD8-33]|uniref:phage scaffolding protein n=1 Tax=Acutalibacter sp. 1XD8-33 TaxID=2320081 RepID=UPI000EA11145|nr:hypothetical protein [Acutalibacter sp. 1XD8-33]RKJ40201.1 hypothetical protein D7X94_08625 [Acutalibacter sp. 1XD8-33]
MALTKAQVREILSAAGVDKEHMSDAVEKIIDGHVASVNALREEIDTYKETAGKLADVQKELEAAQTELSASKNDKWELKYKAIKEDFEAYKAQQSQKDAHAAKEAAYRALLKAAGISEKRLESVLRVSDVDGVELNEKGEVADAKDRLKSLKEEWADFIETREIQGAQISTPPDGAGGGRTMTKEQILAIKDTGERQRAMARNLDLFGIKGKE